MYIYIYTLLRRREAICPSSSVIHVSSSSYDMHVSSSSYDIPCLGGGKLSALRALLSASAAPCFPPIYTYIHICIYNYIYVHTHTHAQTHTYICIRIHIYIMYVCMYVYICPCSSFMGFCCAFFSLVQLPRSSFSSTTEVSV
jgi:hypothetical protein